MSSCHLTAGCSAETRCHTQPVSHAQGTPQLTSLYLLPPQSHSSRQSCASSTGGGSTPQCLEGQADSHDRELLHAQQFFSWSALAVTLGDWEGTGTHTHISKNQSLQAEPVLPLCSFLVAQVAGLCLRGNRDGFAKRVSVLAALQTGWLWPWVSSSQQQLRVFATEISSQ